MESRDRGHQANISSKSLHSFVSNRVERPLLALFRVQDKDGFPEWGLWSSG